MMEEPALNKETIRNPEMWQLYLGVSPDRLEVMAFSTVEEHSMVTAVIDLDPAAPDPARAVEEAVYANPVLLADFRRVAVVVRTDRFTIMPSGLTDSELTERVMAIYNHDDHDGCVTVVNSLPGLDAAIHFDVDAALYNFLMRTFNCPKVSHHLTPLTVYFHGSNRLGNADKTFVNISRDKVDVISFSRDTLLTANTFSWREPLDAVYYILACREMNGQDPGEHELLISGDRDARDAITPLLRKYIAYVMPVIFPSSMFKAGGQAAMNTPFDLIVTPLCE